MEYNELLKHLIANKSDKAVIAFRSKYTEIFKQVHNKKQIPTDKQLADLSVLFSKVYEVSKDNELFYHYLCDGILDIEELSGGYSWRDCFYSELNKCMGIDSNDPSGIVEESEAVESTSTSTSFSF